MALNSVTLIEDESLKKEVDFMEESNKAFDWFDCRISMHSTDPSLYCLLC